MYNKGPIMIGLVVFGLIVTLPIWFNMFDSGPAPEVELPAGMSECVAPAEEMRKNHMKLLDDWRDEVLRESGRKTITVDGKEYQKGLQMACMKCHDNKEAFCDTCHDYASVKPYCWDCHLTPKEQAAK